MKLPTIQCAVCGHPVRMLETFDDISTGDKVLRVHCHGEFDEMRLSVGDFLRLGDDGLRALMESNGTAFTTKKLEKR